MERRAIAAAAGYLELDPGAVSEYSQDGEFERAAVYIHFPFCRHICTYCDFDTFAGLERLIAPYLDAVVDQIHRSPRVQATSLYVGGGTPSLMEPSQAGSLVHACRQRFNLPFDAEITFEANPSGLDLARLQGFREAGFNRLSLGVQSVDARLLRLLGRRHRLDDAETTIGAARVVGFRNVSVDLIYGVPMQGLVIWRETLEAALRWDVQHVSCYMLGLEMGTPLQRGVARGTLQMPLDDQVVEMYEIARELLGNAGYGRYEISNWARPGFESTHNLAYWRNQPYLGIGAGAAGHWRGRRYKIIPDVEAFLRGVRSGRVPLVEDEPFDSRRSMSDTLILGLRLSAGVSRLAYVERFGVAPEEVFGDALDWAAGWGLLQRDADRLRLTDRGIVLSNELFGRLL